MIPRGFKTPSAAVTRQTGSRHSYLAQTTTSCLRRIRRHVCLRWMNTLELPTPRARAAKTDVHCRQRNSRNRCHQLCCALQLRNLWWPSLDPDGCWRIQRDCICDFGLLSCCSQGHVPNKGKLIPGTWSWQMVVCQLSYKSDFNGDVVLSSRGYLFVRRT